MQLDSWMLRPSGTYLFEPSPPKPDIRQLPERPVGKLEDEGLPAIVQSNLPDPDQVLSPAELLLQLPYDLPVGKRLI
jgi:hypothetical protein